MFKVNMIAILFYPFYLVSFWYKDFIGGAINYFVAVNRYTASLLSVPLMLKTFFNPLKNEYRKGLVLFSRIFGMFIKTFLILISSLVIFFLLLVEVFFMLFLAILPFLFILVFLYAK